MAPIKIYVQFLGSLWPEWPGTFNKDRFGNETFSTMVGLPWLIGVIRVNQQFVECSVVGWFFPLHPGYRIQIYRIYTI